MKKLLVLALALNPFMYSMETVDKPARRHHRHHRHTHSTDASIPCLGMDEKELYDIMTKAVATALKKEIEKRTKEENGHHSGLFVRCATSIVSTIVGIIGRHLLPF